MATSKHLHVKRRIKRWIGGKLWMKEEMERIEMSRKQAGHTHTHKYIKTGPVWKCAFPDCRFFVYFAQEHVIIGRRAICWDCSNEFIMDDAAMKEDMPTCSACRIPDVNTLETNLSKRLGG